MMKLRAGLRLAVVLACLIPCSFLRAQVVINEIHYNSEPNTAADEFIELHNPTIAPIDISGWSFSDGVLFTFPPGTTIPAGGYVVVAERPSALFTRYGVTAFGPFEGELSGEGERVQLKNSGGIVVDEVTYQPSFPWPVGAAGTGASMELIHPSLDNDLGGSWRSSILPTNTVSETTVLVPPSDSQWRYREGRSEASSPVDAWRFLNFVEDSSWLTGQTSIGYGDGDDNTIIAMEDQFTTVYLRRAFTVPGTVPTNLTLRIYVDDGAVVWINGVEVARLHCPAGELAYDARASNHTAVWEERTITNVSSLLVPGTNLLAIHALNTTLSSSDFSIDAELRSFQLIPPPPVSPTPGIVNSVHATNAPPQIRQVGHDPVQPPAGQPIVFTAKVTDPEGAASVMLEYQAVAPGAYIPAYIAKTTSALLASPNTPRTPNPTYVTNWTTVAMNDAGSGGDAIAGDGVYTATISGQTNRTLVRYRITAQDTLGASVRVPYADDETLNFATFVYNGVPDYAAPNSVSGSPKVYPASTISSVPVYHLLTDSNNFWQCIGFNSTDQIPKDNFDARDAYNWSGTFVYEGIVYDNIGYRLRQRNSRYINPAGGKRSFNFKFNRGKFPRFRDMDGNYYPTPWDTLSSHKMSGSRNNPGWGIDQAANNALWRLTGTPASANHWFHLRVVRGADEAPAGSDGQYFGDFYGLLLAIEDYDARFLESRDLPKGNIYKLMSFQTDGVSVRKYLAQDAVDNGSDFTNIIFGLRPERNDAWLNQFVNWDQWHRYHAILDAVRHYDMQPNTGEHLKNAAYYFAPGTNQFGKLWVLPWDSDTSWGPNFNGGVDFPKQAIYGVGGGSPRFLFTRDYINAIREIRDLVWTEEQLKLLLDTLASRIAPFVPADRDRWSGAPAAAGTQSQPPIDTVLAGMRNFAFVGGSWTGGNDSQIWDPNAKDSGTSGALGRDNYLDEKVADGLAPAKPIIMATGPVNFPANRLTFESLNYSGFYPMTGRKWRIAEVTLTNELPLPPGTQPKFEITAAWESDIITNVNTRAITIPSSAVRAGHTYRVRCRVKDLSGRWSQWSNPVQFVCSEPDSATAVLASLRVSELMFNSPAGSPLDFVELRNTSSTDPLELSGVKFTQGIDYTFANGTIVDPGGYIVLVRTNFDAFRAFYNIGTNVQLAGPYTGNFDNSGELVTLRTAAGGTDIAQFTYSDGRGWPVSADGSGHSLVPLVVDDQAEGALNYGGNWRASTFINGSPGSADPDPFDTIVINEIAAHTDYPLPPPEDSNDWLELHNRGSTPFTFGPGWYLSDDPSRANLAKWMIPPGTTIPAGGYVSFDERTGFHNPSNTGFGLDKAGEAVVLSYLPGNTNDRVADAVAFRGQESDWSLGRYSDGDPWLHAMPVTTRGTNNAAPPLHVVFTEVMYHPPDLSGGIDDSTNEFVEIYNPTGANIPLFNASGSWRINGGISFTFPSNTVLNAGSHFVLVSFDPANTVQSNAFRNLYGAPAGLKLFGPYSGKLANNVDRVTIEKPEAPDLPGDPVVWVTVDEVIYADRAPWEQGADGIGPSLQRVSFLAHGNNPSNWRAAPASAGAAYAGGSPPAITSQPSPSSQLVSVGSLVSYSVSASGPGPLRYQWLIDDRPVAGATNSTLVFSNATPALSGKYRVVVMNASGSALSVQVELTVKNVPTISAHPANITARPGTNVSFSVSATGSGPLGFVWFRNGIALPGPSSPTFSITNVQAEHQGSYFVSVSDTNGTTLSDSGQLTVYVEPSVVVPPESQEIPEGEEVTMQIISDGTLPITYEWRRNGVPVKTETANSHFNSLTILNVQAAHEGTYVVAMTNPATATPVLSAPVELIVISDTDGDGMPDTWETQFGTNPAVHDAAGDPDADRMTNLQEYFAGTHPNDPLSVLKLDSLRSGTNVISQFTAMSNRTYTVQSRSSLGSGGWEKLADISAAADNRIVWLTNSLSTNGFMRVVTPQQP